MTEPVFTYQHDGQTITIPHISTVPVGVMRKVRKMDQVDASFSILEALVDEQTLEVIDRMTLGEFLEFTRSWDQASQVSAGESSASSES